MAAQKDYLNCQQSPALIGLRLSLFSFDKDGVPVRCSSLDGAVQTVVPFALREHVIALSHEPLCQGYPCGTKNYQMMHHKLYWTFMDGDISAQVQPCHSCAKSNRRCQKKQHKIKLFPSTGPLDDIVIDLL